MNTTPPLNSYAVFKNWDWERIAPDKVRIWQDCTCDLCGMLLEMNSMILFEKNDAALNLSGVNNRQGAERVPAVHIPYAGGPRFCPQHYEAWLERRIKSCNATLEML